MTHRVHNVGNGLMDGFYVELLQRPALPSASIAAPVAAENASARVYNWILAPGATSAMHTHKRPYVIVAATPLQLKMTAPDGESFTENVKAGDFHWVDSKVTHSLTNEGETKWADCRDRTEVAQAPMLVPDFLALLTSSYADP